MLTNLQTRFWSAAKNRATEHGFAFTSGCEALLRGLIDQGINRISDENLLSDSASLTRAETNITMFVDHMVREAQNRNVLELEEDIFQFASAKILGWPFKDDER